MTIWHNSTDTARYLGLDLSNLYVRVFRGQIPRHKLGRKLMFDWDEIDEKIRGTGSQPKQDNDKKNT